MSPVIEVLITAVLTGFGSGLGSFLAIKYGTTRIEQGLRKLQQTQMEVVEAWKKL